MALARILLRDSIKAPNLGSCVNEILVTAAQQHYQSAVMGAAERLEWKAAIDAAEALIGTGRFTRPWTT